MKKAIAIMLAAAAGYASALDNTIDNDFWNTTEYVNATTTSETSQAAAEPIASFFTFETYFSNVLEYFSSFKSGIHLIFR